MSNQNRWRSVQKWLKWISIRCWQHLLINPRGSSVRFGKWTDSPQACFSRRRMMLSCDFLSWTLAWPQLISVWVMADMTVDEWLNTSINAAKPSWEKGHPSAFYPGHVVQAFNELLRHDMLPHGYLTRRGSQSKRAPTENRTRAAGTEASPIGISVACSHIKDTFLIVNLIKVCDSLKKWIPEWSACIFIIRYCFRQRCAHKFGCSGGVQHGREKSQFCSHKPKPESPVSQLFVAKWFHSNISR